VVLGLSPSAERDPVSPYILALQIAPKVAFAPLFVMWLGYTDVPEDPGGDPDRVLPGH
jgi:NitT/TauT family transport system permease protein